MLKKHLNKQFVQSNKNMDCVKVEEKHFRCSGVDFGFLNWWYRTTDDNGRRKYDEVEKDDKEFRKLYFKEIKPAAEKVFCAEENEVVIIPTVE